VAERCPEITFNVVGGSNTDSDYASTLTKRAAGIPNVNMHGRITHVEIAKYYRRSSILCCTSAYEGFPNTFLEAWSCGLPIVSTFDPDNLIAEKGLGQVAKDVSELAAGICELLNSPEQWQKASRAARKYYLDNHMLDQAMERFERIFLDVVDAAK